jgi:hypothetical protein
MTMYQTINFGGFCDAFRALGREDQFTYEAKRMLFDHLEEVDPDHELDVIALCCAYAEEDELDVRFNYSIEGDVLDWLQENTIVLGVTQAGSVVYCSEF